MDVVRTTQLHAFIKVGGVEGFIGGPWSLIVPSVTLDLKKWLSSRFFLASVEWPFFIFWFCSGVQIFKIYLSATEGTSKRFSAGGTSSSRLENVIGLFEGRLAAYGCLSVLRRICRSQKVIYLFNARFPN